MIIIASQLVLVTQLNSFQYTKLNMVRLSDYHLLMLAISKVESDFNPKAFNDKESSHGMLQIRPILIRCVNNIYGTSFTVDDAYRIDRAFKIMKLYMDYWGKGKTLYEKAQIWNGGAYGYKKESTISYANKVMKYYDEYSKHKFVYHGTHKN